MGFEYFFTDVHQKALVKKKTPRNLQMEVSIKKCLSRFQHFQMDKAK